ncbi:argonaute-like protein [Gymnopilus junonius]|uniref:Argonaute-like protein n=1 Tax=Gymnopilus junonius TaxID=109634 RepID=A0A9P5NYR0_GYMJU|nr:argonaute-like protein [Gymnopilus junonius]
MPPRPTARGGGAAPRPPAPAIRGSRGGTPAPAQVDLPSIGSHVTTIGVKRPNFGTGGRELNIFVNSFKTTIPEGVIYHYDVITPSEKTLPARLNMDIIKSLQTRIAPEIFTPRAVYDGRKNIFVARELPFGATGAHEFEVTLSDGRGDPSSRAPKIYKVRLAKVAQINPEVLKRYIAGQQSHDSNVLTAITALNVVIRMEPTMNYPFNSRSFFTDRETKDIGLGIQLWRGYFQSVRPGIGHMLINIDISTATMYKAGPLLRLCMEYMRKQHPMQLANLSTRELVQLQRFISGIRIITPTAGAGGRVAVTPRVVKKLTDKGASTLKFTLHQGGEMTVAEYFKQALNKPLQFPDVICAEVGSGAKIPLELCTVPPGQIMRKQMPAEKTKDVLDFATKRPRDRLESIKNGLNVLAYGQSEYVRQFGMHVNTDGPLAVRARVLKPPTLRYGAGSRQPTIVPSNGSWNMVDKRFYKPTDPIYRWAFIVFEGRNRFNDQTVNETMRGLVDGLRDVGIKIDMTEYVRFGSAQTQVRETLRSVGQEIYQRYKNGPNLFVIVLPEGGNDIYTQVKYFGDVEMGIPTQCMKSIKCSRAKPQYFANVSLKINVKLGGINTIPDSTSVSVLTDPHHPTLVMGADVIHPAPGADGRPSFTSLVGNVDSDTAKYVADSRVQASRQEMIADLYEMSKHILNLYMRYRQYVEKKQGTTVNPKRIIFYRDGVSEGQFQQVLELEACHDLRIDPKITVIVVGKRHHVRFFTQSERDADRSGNCPAGTVIDREVAHPTEFDFYLQSHGGLLGTSRPAHYSVLYDSNMKENGFNADSLQSLSFALCHVYARSTRSVSIPAPVYYADIVCSRAKNHFDPNDRWNFESEDISTNPNATANTLDQFQKGFKPLHQNQRTLMYFSVRSPVDLFLPKN